MNLVMTVVWYPWTESVRGPAGTQGVHRTLFLEMEDARFERLPAVGELIFFDDGGSAPVETIGWRIDGTPYLYLGQRFEKNGEALTVWTERGFREREQPETQKLAAPEAPVQGQSPALQGQEAASAPEPSAPAVATTSASEEAPKAPGATSDAPTAPGASPSDAPTAPQAPPPSTGTGGRAAPPMPPG